jgi:hypothetical protein
MSHARQPGAPRDGVPYRGGGDKAGGRAVPLRGGLAHWRAAYEKAGSGTLQALREADPELVEEDSAALGAALRRILESLPDGGRALVVGHSPTNEAAVLGLAGEIVEPISKGGGVLVVEEDGAVRVEKLG